MLQPAPALRPVHALPRNAAWTARRERSEALLSKLPGATGSHRRALLDQVVLTHLDLADTLARRYAGRGSDHDDLRQVACLGLVKAAQRFDASKGDDFVSFALPTITGEIKRHLRDHGWFVRPPRQVQDVRSRAYAMEGALAQELGRTPRAEELAAALREPVETVREAMGAGDSLRPASLDIAVGDDDSLPLLDTVGGDDPGLEKAELYAALAPAVRRLSRREQLILMLRFFEDRTQQEIADRLGVTQMQISRLLRRILAQLSDALDGAPVTPPAAAGTAPPDGRRRSA